MKKGIFIFLILISLIITSCDIGRNTRPEKPNVGEQSPNISEDEGGQGGRDISTEEDIEPDINYIDIEEDNELTEESATNGAEKQDVTLINEDDIDRLGKDNLSNIVNGASIIEKYNTKIPEEIKVDLRYTQYKVPYDYLLITNERTRIFSKPTLESDSLGSAEFFVKINLIGKVKGQYVLDSKSDEWYALSWMEEGKPVYGFVPSNAGVPRTFQFEKMINDIRELEDQIIQHKYGYISNYKDRNGSPPLQNGKAIDQYGIQAYQSAPAYSSLDDKTNFRYLPDGMLMFILDEQNGYFKVNNLEYEGEYWVPKNYISFEDNLDELIKVVVVDTTNQNQGAFEKTGEEWSLISYTLATTGVEDQHKFETPHGKFKVLEKKDRFYYLGDETQEIAGYAPYGTRFTAGAYIHGVPVDFQRVEGENVDPGIQEYLFTIGTTPRSHKCVRNYTSHAKFIYDWAEVNNTAVIVID